jgi:hypothetical protein
MFLPFHKPPDDAAPSGSQKDSATKRQIAQAESWGTAVRTGKVNAMANNHLYLSLQLQLVGSVDKPSLSVRKGLEVRQRLSRKH